MPRVSRSAAGRAAVAAALALPILLAAAPCAPLAAQEPVPAAASTAPGRIVGYVSDDKRAPVAGAQVVLVGTGFGGTSSLDGRYRIMSVPAGSYQMRVTRIGQKPRLIDGVVVRAGEETIADVTLQEAAAALGGVVVSASRRVEKITDAPATVTSISTEQLDAAVGNSFTGALKEAKGLDFIQTGMSSVAVNARGFNSSFNSRMLFVEDGRISVIPESGLPLGSLTPNPKIDLAGMEVLVGPGSALYGPDASNGVISLRTKDPRAFPGTTFEVVGGNRSYVDVQARHAGVAGNFGYKVAGEYNKANDWDNYLNYSPGGSIVAPGTAGSVNERDLKLPVDWGTSVMRGTGGVVYYRGDSRLELNGGMSRTNGVAQTNVGRNQLKDWDINTIQARWTSTHWYANAYRTQSKSGESFALNRFAGAQLNAANASLSTDSLRKLSDWPSDGRMMAAELQGNYSLGLLANTAMIFGAQYRDDVVSSDRQWLTDRITKEDVSNAQKGVYAQTTTPLSRFLDVVLAGRYDSPENYDKQWSPKAGVVIKPWTDQAFRVTYNRAFKSPTILQTDFFIPDWTSIISIYGNTGGFKSVDSAGTTKATYSALKPETNKTWEFGYKGVLANRLFLDATYFRSNYENFMSPLTIVGNPFAGAARTYAVPLANPNGIPVDAQGRVSNGTLNPLVLIYYNLGNAKLSGIDAGLTAMATDHLEIRGTMSDVKLSDLALPPGGSLEAAALNAPKHKWTLGTTYRDLGPLTVGSTLRNVQGYYFRSGTNTGVIPTFATVDATASLHMAMFPSSSINLSVSNLYGCTSEKVSYQTPTGAQANSAIKARDKACGFGRRHREMINMPEIGTMAFLGVRYQL